MRCPTDGQDEPASAGCQAVVHVSKTPSSLLLGACDVVMSLSIQHYLLYHLLHTCTGATASHLPTAAVTRGLFDTWLTSCHGSCTALRPMHAMHMITSESVLRCSCSRSVSAFDAAGDNNTHQCRVASMQGWTMDSIIINHPDCLCGGFALPKLF
jgi:hypothetical protein